MHNAKCTGAASGKQDETGMSGGGSVAVRDKNEQQYESCERGGHIYMGYNDTVVGQRGPNLREGK